MASAVDGYLLAARYAKSTRGQVTDAVRALQDVGAAVLGSVLNMVPAKRDSEQYGYGYAYRPRTSGRRERLRLLPRLRHRGRPATIGVFPAPAAPTGKDTTPAGAKEGGDHH
jgi:non-specific protein-tyrosine kinase